MEELAAEVALTKTTIVIIESATGTPTILNMYINGEVLISGEFAGIINPMKRIDNR